MRITEAARRLGTSPRMLRYRDELGLLPPVRPARTTSRGRTGTAVTPHRRFDDADLAAVGLALEIEQRFDVSPAALAFALRVLADPGAQHAVAELGRRIGRITPRPASALEFEKERAQRLLSLAPRSAAPPLHAAEPNRSPAALHSPGAGLIHHPGRGAQPGSLDR